MVIIVGVIDVTGSCCVVGYLCSDINYVEFNLVDTANSDGVIKVTNNAVERGDYSISGSSCIKRSGYD